jgi:flagellar M-ring protein FliF
MAPAKGIFEKFVLNFIGSTLGQKIAMFVVVAAVIGGLVSLTKVGSTLQYQVLYSGLTQEDAADVVASLKEARILYQLSAEGATVMVPAGQVYEIRLTLAGEGLPRGGGVGFEIFDKTSLGTTDFVQRLNYQRAMQGELARTIRQFRQVQEARVHIATPKESVFIEDEKQPTASVSLKLRGKEQLSNSEVKAIVHLVASSIPGLSIENVSVVDTSGHLLYRGQGGKDSFLSDNQLEYQFAVEEKLRRKIETMLEEVVGVNHVRARVNANIEFSRVNYTEENYDPEGQVMRSEQVETEGDGGAGGQPQGIPGVKGDLAGLEGAGGGSSSSGAYQRNNITRNYEISRQTKHVQEATGIIKKLSVAVMVDGTFEEVVDKEGKSSLQYKPRTQEEMQFFDKLIKNAIGYSEDREDQVELVNMSFALVTVPEGEPVKTNQALELAEKFAAPIFYLMLGVVFLLFFVRPFLKTIATMPIQIQKAGRVRAASSGVGGSEAEFEEEDEDSLQPKKVTDKEKIYRLAQSDPDRAADLVRRWLREEG